MENKKTPDLVGIDKAYEKIIPTKNETKILNIVGTGVHYEDRLITDRNQLKWLVGIFKKEGKKIVYTSGVYDLLHEGHIKYLNKAAAIGDILIVGVDSDELTRIRKPIPANRPIVGLQERLFMLANIRSVNILTIRDEHEHEDQLIVDILPDVAIFSHTTKDTANFEQKIRKNISKYCGEIIFFDPQAVTSTTARIRLLAMDGSKDLANAINETVHNFLNPKKEEGTS